MEESMEEEEVLIYEAMMDDQNHNNWEAAVDGFRQPPPPPPPPPPPSSMPVPAREPPGGQLLAVPAVSVDRKGPKEGLPLGPEANGVIMMLKSCDAAAVAKAAPAPTPGSTININTSTSKFRESSLSPAARLLSSPPGRQVHPAPGAAPLPLFQAWVSSPPLPPPPPRLCPRPAPERAWLLVLPGLGKQPGTYATPSSATNAILIATGVSQHYSWYSPIWIELSASSLTWFFVWFYSCVYKCVCQQHSEQMYSDLIKKITNHLERVSKELQASPPDLYIERFNIALGQYMGALQSIVPLFIYMNKFYIETKLNRDLKDDLIKLFTEHVAEKHIYSLMPLLLEAQSTPFQVTPSTMANIVKGLYTLRPEWVQMAPTLFSKFIPNILPPAVESELSEYAAQDQKLQRELIQNGFTRGDQSRKRAGDELAYNSSSACASSRGYR
ncbi:CDK2 associated cullin domain 1 [Ictidomys tridecemlineatus]|nr:CDK2 associated cullin domain 1 [Ictidomys tridecemlineatus]